MVTAALTQCDHRRLLKLAAKAERTPQAMLKFVLRDGFDYCEYVVEAVNEGIADRSSSDIDEVEARIVRRRERRDRAAA
ncbi:MAG: hypothetical protein A3H35_12375 [Betaproteobacteria bacterium RIFCSPLOWO2_02_FULL_62_17]|nr:MAG: hypothetical protein A3H35_12375 [Betaproteobacteria bacterium RIFCSPLOWO2_02_FULL_62_17]